MLRQARGLGDCIRAQARRGMRCGFPTTPFQKSKKIHKQSGSPHRSSRSRNSLATVGGSLRSSYLGGHMRKYGSIKLGLAAVILISASAASEGADVLGGPAYPPPAPPIPFVYNWTGFYAGAHAGVGWSDGGGSS